MAFDSEEATWLRTSLESDGRLEPPLPGIPLTTWVITGTAGAAGAAGAEDEVALRPLLALIPVPVLAAPLLSADPRGLGSVPGRWKNKEKSNTERGVLSVARFCYVFPCELRGPAWAVGSYSISQSAGGTSQNIIFKTLRQIGRPAL